MTAELECRLLITDQGPTYTAIMIADNIEFQPWRSGQANGWSISIDCQQFVLGSPQDTSVNPMTFPTFDAARTFHYAAQSANMITLANSYTSNKVFTTTRLDVYGGGVDSALDLKVDNVIGKALSTEDYTTAEKTKLAGLATVATSGSYIDLTNKPSVDKVYSGTALKSNPVLYCNSATVASGIAVFYLTADGTSTGTALFPNGPITTSLNCFVSDSAASYQMAGVWSNSNKTLTVTTNKLGTANILTGILGQAAGNGAVVNVQVWGN